MEAGLLIKRDSVRSVGAAENVPATTTVVTTSKECEWLDACRRSAHATGGVGLNGIC